MIVLIALALILLKKPEEKDCLLIRKLRYSDFLVC